ncbi:hypothetical protein Lnau_2734 [Legionella nautarum]|uniref:Uncharacterized protein n=1 Tax=Legionella nautarum TaxID=45070 RepID=A0A0W0WL85_9GAMM|nr:hypothetical protein [Legionella nautarum]KTD33086.1 hypothetical protein Lnau_2734 [Legionella nautarum]
MSSSLALRTELIEVDTYLPLSDSLAFDLEQFTRKHYRIANHHQFNEQILSPETTGSLGVFYDLNNKIVGFSRICRHSLQVQDSEFTAYIGGTYYDPRIDLSFTAARFCLAKAIRYKLERPHENMAYFSLVSTPTRFQFLSKLNNGIYPNEETPIPEFVLVLVEHLKRLHHWETDAKHPMLIHNQIPLLNPPILEDEADPLINYYLSLNPNYSTGTSLLIYLPINLANISLGIKRVLMKMRPPQAYLHETKEVTFS